MHSQIEDLPDRIDRYGIRICIAGMVDRIIQAERPVPIIFLAEEKAEQAVFVFFICSRHRGSFPNYTGT